MREVKDIRLGDHLCLDFAHEAEQQAVIVQFVADGLARNERVLYFTDGPRPKQVRSWLATAGIDVPASTARGQLSIDAADNTYLASGAFDPGEMIATLRREIDASRRAGYAGLRVTGEMSWALGRIPGAERLEEYERRLAGLFAEGSAAAICQYDRRLFPADRHTALLDAHADTAHVDAILRAGDLRLIPAFDPDGARVLHVLGSIDHSATGVWAEALGTAASWGGDVRIDMADLEFIDVAGIRELTRCAETLPRGRRLHVRNLAPMLGMVIKVVGWDQTPSLVIEEQEVYS